MKRILITGAAGGVATMIRPILRAEYRLRLSDVKPVSDARRGRGGDHRRPRRHGGAAQGGRRHRRHRSPRRLRARDRLGNHPRRQHRRALQPLRGGPAGGRQAGRLRLQQPCHGLLPARARRSPSTSPCGPTRATACPRPSARRSAASTPTSTAPKSCRSASATSPSSRQRPPPDRRSGSARATSAS